jgi:small conductance mechanosensitive channel
MDQPDNPLIDIALRLAGAFLVLLIGRALARRSRSTLSRALQRRSMAPSIVRLLALMTYYGVLLLAVMLGLALLGLPLTTTLVVLLIVLVVLGIALQQSISNLAATIVFMLFQPFKLGDLIQAGGVMGTVKEIQFLSTVLVTANNLVVTIPNGKIQGEVLINYSTLDMLRTDTTLTVSHRADVEQVTRVLADVLTADGRVLSEPAPQTFVQALGENGMEFAVRAWVKSADYWAFQQDLPGQIKIRFDAEGIAIAHPQREVRMLPASSVPAGA